MREKAEPTGRLSSSAEPGKNREERRNFKSENGEASEKGVRLQTTSSSRRSPTRVGARKREKTPRARRCHFLWEASESEKSKCGVAENRTTQRSPSDGQASVKLWKTETLGKPGRSTPMRRPSPGVHTPQIHEEATGEKRRVSVQREAARWTARKGEVFAEERLSQARRGRLREGSERGSRVEEREGNERKKEKV
ncbi:hypothetical protein TGVAND_236830 [Toxoplasma gondii VAND]|uniref:Uncharacterized protein n=1 Tax=Toxoplasma gondii VAND TaxID=933077 RepID=A0A086Q4L0_TOXGO|nr:hypothetical protein TGVAND_236830 [Toxoplasma gondii VAND]